jgi:diguanylate cyclase (GGDEF)-like protein
MGVAERVRVAVARAPVITGRGRAMELTVSIGVACLHDADRHARSLIAAADECLYRAKRSGKNSVVVR